MQRELNKNFVRNSCQSVCAGTHYLLKKGYEKVYDGNTGKQDTGAKDTWKNDKRASTINLILDGKWV